MRGVLVVGLLLAPVLAGCFHADPSAGGPVTDEDGEVVAWRFRDTDGVEHTNTTAEGNVSVLFFMASWCSTCKHKTGMLRSVEADVAGDGVGFYTVSWEPRDDEAAMRSWKETYDQPWPHGVDEDLRMTQHFGITSQSSVVVLRADGGVHQKWGFPGPSESDLRDAVAAAG